MRSEPAASDYDAIIVGAGMGGLSTAASLARAGYRVLVLEQHYRSGGYAHSFRRRRFEFDSAVRIVAGAEHGLLARLLDQAGVKDVEFLRLPDAYSAYYPDFTLRVPATVEGFVAEHVRRFPHEAEGIRALTAEMLRIYYAVLGALEANDPNYLLSNPYILKYHRVPFTAVLTAYVKDPRAVSALASLWAYYGTPPERGSALFFAYAIMSYFVEGIYYVKGSFQKLADAYVRVIEQHGGEVRLSNPVERILVENKRVVGVEARHGGVIRAPLVISNADALTTCRRLVGVEHLGDRYIRKLERLSVAMSCYEVFIGTDLPLEAYGLGHESFVFDGYDHAGIFDRHRRLLDQGAPGVSGFALSCPSLADSSLAPQGHHTLVITTLVPYAAGGRWKEQKAAFTQHLLGRAGQVLPGLPEHVVELDAGTPLTLERYTRNSFGSPYGWEQSLDQTRPGHQTPVEGLYLVGHWTDPGGGVVSVLLSGYRLAQRLLGGNPALPGLVAKNTYGG